jgi:hypothetical protein
LKARRPSSTLSWSSDPDKVSLDGLLADKGTEYRQFCFGLPVARGRLRMVPWPS